MWNTICVSASLRLSSKQCYLAVDRNNFLSITKTKIMSQDKTIVLHTYTDITEAKMIQEKLEDSGISSFLHEDNVMGLDPVSGVELKIFEKDKEAAEKIVAA
jgi:Putative prokaryotic signal transducing protein